MSDDEPDKLAARAIIDEYLQGLLRQPVPVMFTMPVVTVKILGVGEPSEPTPEPVDDPPYLIRFWGSIADEAAEPLALLLEGLDCRRDHAAWCVWFQTRAEREAFKESLRALRDFTSTGCVWDDRAEGEMCRTRCVVEMTLVLPDGRRFPHSYDFGYGYSDDAAEFMYRDGNYSCDCSLSGSLHDAGYDVEELECGSTIQIEDFRIERVIETTPDGTDVTLRQREGR